MKTEIQHFTDAPEIQSFHEFKAGKNDNSYGVLWANVVREYLKTAYSDESTQADVISNGITYKALKREEVTAFYDADGNTLFDVENKRLEKEYGFVMGEDGMISGMAEKNENEQENAGRKCTTGISKSGLCGAAAYCAEEVECCSECGNPCNIRCGWLNGQEHPSENAASPAAVEGNQLEADCKEKACEKLRGELGKVKDKEFAKPVIEHLLKRCGEDAGLVQDVMQEHKTWEKCFDYIYSQARKQSKGNCAAVRDDVVYEWAEDYYHKDDKTEEERKAQKAAGRKKKEEERKKKAVEQKKTDKKDTKQGAEEKEKSQEKPADPPKPKKNQKELDGQLDLFSMMGM